MVQVRHNGKEPAIHPTAYVAPNAVLSGDVRIGEHTCILYGAVLTAEGGSIDIGPSCVIMEHAVLRGSRRHSLQIGARALVGPHAHVTGCSVADEVFLATGSTVFNGAILETLVEVRINGVVHANSRLPRGSVVPIGWVAVGDPAEVLPPGEHERIWKIQEQLNFPGAVFGLDREEHGAKLMQEMMSRYTNALRRHQSDGVLVDGE